MSNRGQPHFIGLAKAPVAVKALPQLRLRTKMLVRTETATVNTTRPSVNTRTEFVNTCIDATQLVNTCIDETQHVNTCIDGKQLVNTSC